MKKLLMFTLIILPLISNGQTSELNKLFDKHSGQKGFTSLHITKHMFSLFRKIENAKEGREFNDAITSLNSIKLLSVDSATHANMNYNLINEVLTSLSIDKYTELMVFKQNGRETITILIREEGAIIKEFLMTIDSPQNAVLIFLEGDINLEKISNLSKTMNIQGFEHLDKIDKNK